MQPVRSLYLMSGRTDSMRSFAAARLWLALTAWRAHGLRLDRIGRWVTIEVLVPWPWLLALGLWHLWLWWRASRLAQKAASKLGVDLEIRVRCRNVGKRKTGVPSGNGSERAREPGAGRAGG